MYSIEQLQEKATRMAAYLEKPYSSDPDSLMERMSYLSVLMAQSGQCLADAKYFQDTVINGAIMEAIQKAYEERLSASTINKFVTTAAKEQNYLVNTFDRINASATHLLDAVRTAISYEKSKMNLM
jgi:hypothetical protein